jgi:hypothetical protein
VPSMTLRSEVKVLTWSSNRGNPTSMRQGRGPELTGRHVGGQHGRRASARAGLKEAVDALWLRTKVKRREGVRRRVSWLGGSDAPFLLVWRAYWRRDRGEISTPYLGRSTGSRRGWPVGRRTRGRRSMAQQKSEDRVVPDGGVMPVQPSGSSPGGQGKGGPGRRSGVAAAIADRDSRSPAREPSCDGGAEGDRQRAAVRARDDG